MASAFIRSVNRASLPSLRSRIPKSAAASPPFSALKPPMRRRSPLLYRSPVELGCCGLSLFPLHSAVAAARMTSRLTTTTLSYRDLSQGVLPSSIREKLSKKTKMKAKWKKQGQPHPYELKKFPIVF